MALGKFKIRFDVIGLVGIIVGVAGLYTYYRGTSPKLEIVVDSATNVVDVNERVAGLGVLFNGEDLLQKNKALTIYSLNIRNSGNEPIRKGDFDESALVGFELSGADVLTAQVDTANTSSDTYVRQNARFARVSPNRVFLRPMIIDPDARIGLRVVAIHDAKIKPDLRSLGKVVGQTRIPVIIGAERDERGLWQRAVGGGLGVNLVRLPIYFLGFLLVLLVAIVVPTEAKDWFKRQGRKKAVRKYLEGRQETASLRWLLDEFVRRGFGQMAALSALAEDPNRQQKANVRGRSMADSFDLNSPPGLVFGSVDDHPGYRMALRSGLLMRAEDGSFTTNAAIKRELDDFLKEISPGPAPAVVPSD